MKRRLSSFAYRDCSYSPERRPSSAFKHRRRSVTAKGRRNNSELRSAVKHRGPPVVESRGCGPRGRLGKLMPPGLAWYGTRKSASVPPIGGRKAPPEENLPLPGRNQRRLQSIIYNLAAGVKDGGAKLGDIEAARQGIRKFPSGIPIVVRSVEEMSVVCILRIRRMVIEFSPDLSEDAFNNMVDMAKNAGIAVRY